MRKSHTHVYRDARTAKDLIQWLRSQGERSYAWDFSGPPGNLTIIIFDEKIELAYQMKYEWS